MKRFFLLAVMAVAGISLAVAQPRAIGGRLGYGAEFSYQHALGESNMIQLEVGAPAFAMLEATCTYDWINPGGVTVPWNEKGSWNWFAGVGGTFQASWWSAGAAFIGATGRIGIEYNFWFPLQLSVDFRPSLGCAIGYQGGVGFGYDVYAGAIGLGVRYAF